MPDPQQVYQHALRFFATDRILSDVVERDRSQGVLVQHPAMVISTFASELLLKCLLLIEGKQPPITHNLKVLFDLLDQKQRQRIEELWDADVAARKSELDEVEQAAKAKIPRDLATALSECGDAVVLLRYLYDRT